MADQWQIFTIEDLSGGQQTKTTSFLQRPNESDYTLNADLSVEIGAVSKRAGYTQRGNDLTSTSTSTSTTTTSTSTTTTTSTSTSSTTSTSTT